MKGLEPAYVEARSQDRDLTRGPEYARQDSFFLKPYSFPFEQPPLDIRPPVPGRAAHGVIPHCHIDRDNAVARDE